METNGKFGFHKHVYFKKMLLDLRPLQYNFLFVGHLLEKSMGGQAIKQ